MEKEENVGVGVRKMYRSATIDVVANGFIIKIGCRHLVAESPENLKKLICSYLDDPVGTEKDIFENDITRNRAMEPVSIQTNTIMTDKELASAGLREVDNFKSDRGHSLKVKSYE